MINKSLNWLLLFNGVERCIKVSWRGLFEKTKQLKGILLRVPLVASASLTKEIALAGCDFVSKVTTLRRKSGYLFTALYLKQCAVCLQRYYAGSFRKEEPLSVPVSLTRSGIPRIIPKVLRKAIRRKDEHGDYLVRIYLSWFGLAKVLKVAPKVSKATFESITTPHPDIGSVLEVLEEIKTSFKHLQPMYLPFLRGIPMEIGMSWQPTWKSTPLNDNFVRSYGLAVDDKVDQEASKYFKFPNIFVNLKHELAAFIWNINKIHSFQDGFFSPGMLWSKSVFFPLDRAATERLANLSLEHFEKSVGPWFSTLLSPYRGVPLVTGRLGAVIEGGGKRRVFVMCNYIKQRLLHPVHDWAMTVLSKIKTDGTFDQEKPLLALKQKNFKNCYSFDLKSATDRWPLSVMYTLMSMIWGPTLASSIVNSSLGLNTILVNKPLTKRVYEIAFLTGQPLGFHGSWALFSLSHHYIVWLAASKAYPGCNSPFGDYALLGDDILITDSKVANEYKILLDRLNVKISIPKSLISDNGTIEFAKRFWTKSMQIDLSPISLRALLSCRTTVGLCALAIKYDINISVLQRLGGAGYKVRARLFTTQSKRWERLKAAHLKPVRSHLLPYEWWIGRGMPLNPYLKGKIVSYLLKELKVKELQIFPKDLVFDGEVEILERTVLRQWVEQWLKWLNWYHTICMNPDVSIKSLIDSPICATSWKRLETDFDLIKFGLIWKCYDMGAGWNPSTTPQWLFDPNTVIQFNKWILGGYTGNDFIMSPVEYQTTGKEEVGLRL